MNKNYTRLVEYNKAQRSETEQKVITAINELKRSDEEFTLIAVCKKAGVSRSYFYKHQDMLDLINTYRKPTGNKRKQSKDAKDVIITSLKAEIKDLNKKLAAVQVNDNYKLKYEEALERIAQLEKELKEALEMNLDLNF